MRLSSSRSIFGAFELGLPEQLEQLVAVDLAAGNDLIGDVLDPLRLWSIKLCAVT